MIGSFPCSVILTHCLPRQIYNNNLEVMTIVLVNGNNNSKIELNHLLGVQKIISLEKCKCTLFEFQYKRKE